MLNWKQVVFKILLVSSRAQLRVAQLGFFCTIAITVWGFIFIYPFAKMDRNMLYKRGKLFFYHIYDIKDEASRPCMSRKIRLFVKRTQIPRRTRLYTAQWMDRPADGLTSGQTNQRTDQPADGPADRVTYRVACTWLIIDHLILVSLRCKLSSLL